MPNPLQTLTAQYEADRAHLVAEAVRDHAGNLQHAADALGIPRGTLYYLIKRTPGLDGLERRGAGRPKTHNRRRVR